VDDGFLAHRNDLLHPLLDDFEGTSPKEWRKPSAMV
jgi:hypothetical protein